MNYKYTTLNFALKHIPEMEQKKDSFVERSKGQFIDQFRKVKGNPSLLPEFWQKKRNAFISRHLAQYKIDHGKRRRLALIAWAYNP